MKVCVIGGANIDISAVSSEAFRHGDSNPGKIRISPGGVARNIAHNLALLGDEVQLMTVFGNDSNGRMLYEDCKRIGIGTDFASFSETAGNPCFVSVSDRRGELVGGVSDMAAVDEITVPWLEARIECIEASDAVVADANLSADALRFLVKNVKCPLYLDAVSGPKAERMRDALLGLPRQCIHALKCNRTEAAILAPILPSLQRCYISLGPGGVQTVSGNEVHIFPALPCTVRNTSGGGDAMLAGIVHAGSSAPIEEVARIGLLCAKCAVESDDAVNDNLKNIEL